MASAESSILSLAPSVSAHRPAPARSERRWDSWPLFGPVVLYLILDLVLGRLATFSGRQWQFYALSLIGSLALWIVAVWLLSRIRKRSPGIAVAMTIGVAAVYGVNLVLVYGYRLTVGVMPNYFTFTFLFDEPKNSWVLLIASLKAGHFAAIALAVALFAAILFRAQRAPFIARRSSWTKGAMLALSAVLFVVVQLIFHNNIRFVDQCYTADLTTSTGVLRNIYTRFTDEKIVRSGLMARIPAPLPDLPDHPAGAAMTPDGRPMNLLVILTESLRADELDVFSGRRGTTPYLDSILTADPARFYVFNRAFSNASSTFISVPSLVTGLVPVAPARLVHTQPVFWEYFRSMGRETFFMTSQSLNWRHIKTFFAAAGIDHTFDLEISGAPRINDMGTDDSVVTAHFVDWLSHRDATVPFAGILQFNQTHYPYWTDPSARPYGASTPRDRYDNAVRYTDGQLQRVFRELQDQGQWDRTVVVFTSDHSEAFMEHGFIGHLEGLYVECVHIPVFWMIPPTLRSDPACSSHLDILRANTARNISNIDLLPTLLDFGGVWSDPAIAGFRANCHGQSLLEPVDPLRPILSSNSSETSRSHSGVSLILGDWHYFLNLRGAQAGTQELFYWGDDPDEQINRMATATDDLKARIYSEFARYDLCRRIFAGYGIKLDQYLTPSS